MKPDRTEVPGKRLRNWHRRHLAIEQALPESKQQRPGLKEFARATVALGRAPEATPSDKDRARVAQRWLTSKGARP